MSESPEQVCVVRDEPKPSFARAISMMAVIIGLTAWLVQNAKDTKVENGNILVSKGNGQALQVASTDLMVTSGVLVGRNAAAQGGSQPLGVRTQEIVTKAWYEVTHMELDAIKGIVIYPSNTTELFVQVTGAARVPGTDFAAPSILFFTPLGPLRATEGDATLLNGDVLDYLEKVGVPTCRNPSGNGTVASAQPLCNILIPSGSHPQGRRRLLQSGGTGGVTTSSGYGCNPACPASMAYCGGNKCYCYDNRPYLIGMDCNTPSGCVAGYAKCGGSVCQDLTADTSCGRCDNICMLGKTCMQGACWCPRGQIACPTPYGECCTSPSSISSCGGCSKQCTSGQTCTLNSNGVYGCSSCPSGQTLCIKDGTGICVDPSSTASCGATGGSSCGAQCAAGLICTQSNGVYGCTCPSGTTNCNGVCKVSNSPYSCGCSGTVCLVFRPTCKNGACV